MKKEFLMTENQQNQTKDPSKLVREVRETSVQNNHLISEFQKHLSNAESEKVKRNSENSQVRMLKHERDEAEAKIKEVKKSLSSKQAELKKIEEHSSGRSYSSIKQELEQLEWKQQTESSPRIEKELSKKIKELHKMAERTEKAEPLWKEVKTYREELGKLIGESRKARELLQTHAKNSELHHQKMIDEEKKADSVRQKITRGMEELDEKRKLASEAKAEYVKAFQKNKEEQKTQQQQNFDRKAREKGRQYAALKEKAKQIYEQFKQGKSISTEEMMILSESGLLA